MVTSMAHIDMTVNGPNKQIGCELYIPNSKQLFEELYKNKEPIEADIGQPLKWMGLERKN